MLSGGGFNRCRGTTCFTEGGQIGLRHVGADPRVGPINCILAPHLSDGATSPCARLIRGLRRLRISARNSLNSSVRGSVAASGYNRLAPYLKMDFRSTK
jgi:hypothetical protein